MSLRTFRLLGLVLVIAAQRELAAQVLAERQVAAPASDISSGVVRLPDPASTPTISYATLLPLRFERADDGAWVARVTFPVEREGELALALLSPDAASWKVLAAPAGAPLRSLDEAFAPERRVGFASELLPGWIIDRRDMRGTPAGLWTVQIEAREPSSSSDGWLLASAGTDLRAEAFVTTQHTVAGEPIAVAARVTGRELLRVDRARVLVTVAEAVHELALFDDGEHDDGAAQDGLFGAYLPADIAGEVRARVELTGTTRAGREFLRCAPLAFSVLQPRLLLDGTANGNRIDDRRLAIDIGAYPLGPAQRLHLSAEVWGHDANGELVPACWLSRMTDPRVVADAWQLSLELDTRWLDVARASTPLELRNVRVQDPDSDVVLAFEPRIELGTPTLRAGDATEITSEMLTGSNSLALGGASPIGPYPEVPDGLFTRALMLVHGYCSGGSIWPAADFTQPKLVFLDPSANRSHDQFAQLLAQQAQSAGLGSFGIVGHSQGGPAALHLLTYYTSGLDRAVGGRRIQSVASPYQGTPLASLGGFTCGVNNDMTPAGAATWLAGIPNWARQQVFYWTTSNSGSACNFFTGMLLTDPEDGTVEQFRGQLPGANNMGHVVGWCHTTGMSNPANYTDHARNQAMNAAAAR